MPLRILSGKGAVQIMPFRKLGGKCHFLLRFCTRKRSETYVRCNLVLIPTENIINRLQCMLSHSASCTRSLVPVVVVVAAAVLAGRDFVVSAVAVFTVAQHQ